MSHPLILENEIDIEHLHTVQVEADDDMLMVHDQIDDCVTSRITTLAWPLHKVPAICAAMMRAAREAGAA